MTTVSLTDECVEFNIVLHLAAERWQRQAINQTLTTVTMPAVPCYKGGGEGGGGNEDPRELGCVTTADHLDSTLLGVPSCPIGLSNSAAIAGGGNIVLPAADSVVCGGKTILGGGSSILPCLC